MIRDFLVRWVTYFFSRSYLFFSICCAFFTHWVTFSPCLLFRAGLIAHLYAHPSHNPSAVGPLELANALAACCLSSRLSSQHRQWAAQQLVRTLAAHDRDNNQSRPQTFADMAGDLRKCSCIKLEAHQGRVSVNQERGIGVCRCFELRQSLSVAAGDHMWLVQSERSSGHQWK